MQIADIQSSVTVTSLLVLCADACVHLRRKVGRARRVPLGSQMTNINVDDDSPHDDSYLSCGNDSCLLLCHCSSTHDALLYHFELIRLVAQMPTN